MKCDSRTDVTRVPIQAVRSIDGKHYVALHQPSRQGNAERSWKWKRVELGISDPNFVEVLSGLKVGERVVANSRLLPIPDSLPDEPAEAPSLAKSECSLEDSHRNGLQHEFAAAKNRLHRAS